MRYIMRFMLFACSTGFLLIFISPSPSYAQTGCDLKDLGQLYGTGTLTFSVPHVDNATWISTFTVNVPLSWPLARSLFQDPNSDGYQQAYNCLFTDDAFFNPDSTSVSLNQNYVKVQVSNSGPVDDWLVSIPSPWNVTFNNQGLSISLMPSQGQPYIYWTEITANIHGFGIANPDPLPASEPSRTKFIWQSVFGKNASLISFTLLPEKLMRVVLTAQTGGRGQWIPLHLEEIVFLIVFIAIFRWRRRKSIDGADDTRFAQRLCLTAAVLSAAQLGTDIATQVTLYSGWVYIGQYIVEVAVIYTAGFAALRSRLRELGRSLNITFSAVILLCFIGSISDGILRYAIYFNFGSYLSLADKPFYAVLRLVTILCITFLSWTIILDGLLSLFCSIPAATRRPLLFILVAGNLALLSMFANLNGNPLNIFPTVFLSSIVGFIIVFSVPLTVARRHRSIPLLLDGSDRILIALTIGYGMLLTGPQWYLGFRIGLVSVFGFLATLIVLTVSRNHSLIKPATEGYDSHVKPAGIVLKGLAPKQLRDLQQRLFDSEDKLTKVTKDLTVLQSTPLVTEEQLARREWLEREQKRLRSWPPVESNGEVAFSARLNSSVRYLLAHQKDNDNNGPGVEFPVPAGPVDMALALGPNCDPAGNLRRAFRPALILILAPACYFAWRENLANPFGARGALYYIGLLENLSQALTFWLLTPLVLAVAWTSLAGRRGSERGLQVWLFVSLPMAIHVFFNQIFDQSATLTSVLQCAILLVVLLILGVWIDLSTLRSYRSNVTSFKLFQGYVRLNRVVAAFTLVLPLATAGLTIWNQVNSGALHQKVSPAQVAVNTQSPAPSASPTPSPHISAHPTKTAARPRPRQSR